MSVVDKSRATVLLQATEQAEGAGGSSSERPSRALRCPSLFSAWSIKLFRVRCSRRSSVICRRRTDQKGLLSHESRRSRGWGYRDNATLEMPDRRVIYDGLSHSPCTYTVSAVWPGQPDAIRADKGKKKSRGWGSGEVRG